MPFLGLEFLSLPLKKGSKILGVILLKIYHLLFQFSFNKYGQSISTTIKSCYKIYLALILKKTINMADEDIEKQKGGNPEQEGNQNHDDGDKCKK